MHQFMTCLSSAKTHIFKNVGTVWSLAGSKGNFTENRVVMVGGSRGMNNGNVGESQQHQHSTAAAQQQ